MVQRSVLRASYGDQPIRNTQRGLKILSPWKKHLMVTWIGMPGLRPLDISGPHPGQCHETKRVVFLYDQNYHYDADWINPIV